MIAHQDSGAEPQGGSAELVDSPRPRPLHRFVVPPLLREGGSRQDKVGARHTFLPGGSSGAPVNESPRAVAGASVFGNYSTNDDGERRRREAKPAR